MGPAKSLAPSFTGRLNREGPRSTVPISCGGGWESPIALRSTRRLVQRSSPKVRLEAKVSILLTPKNDLPARADHSRARAGARSLNL